MKVFTAVLAWSRRFVRFTRDDVIAHMIHSVPLVVIILSTAVDQVWPELELAAMTIGAPRARAWLGITLRSTSFGDDRCRL